jgi:hypothetical protein
MAAPVDRVVVQASRVPVDRAVVRIRPVVVPVDRVVVQASPGVPACRACCLLRLQARRRMGVVRGVPAVRDSVMNRVA